MWVVYLEVLWGVFQLEISSVSCSQCDWDPVMGEVK